MPILVPPVLTIVLTDESFGEPEAPVALTAEGFVMTDSPVTLASTFEHRTLEAALLTTHEHPPIRAIHTTTSLAATRTRMAADRTMMAWIRTALSLFSFGFTLYKVLQAFEEAGKVLPGASINTPRVVGLFLTGMGTLAILMGTTQYVMSLHDLAAHGKFPLVRPPLLMAFLMSVGGVVLFVGIVARVL